MNFTYQDFIISWKQINDRVPSYRLGQHFINLFIKDCSDFTCSEVCKGLWNKTGDEAFKQIKDIINVYQWDLNDLPIMNKHLDLWSKSRYNKN